MIKFKITLNFGGCPTSQVLILYCRHIYGSYFVADKYTPAA